MVYFRLPKDSQAMQARDDYFLDFGSARVNLSGNSIAQFALDLILGHVPVAAEDLDGVEAALYRSFTDKKFRNRSLTQGMLTLTLKPCRLVQDEPASLEPHFHLRDFVRNGGKFSDRLPELVAVAGVFHRLLQQTLHH